MDIEKYKKDLIRKIKILEDDIKAFGGCKTDYESILRYKKELSNIKY